MRWSPFSQSLRAVSRRRLFVVSAGLLLSLVVLAGLSAVPTGVWASQAAGTDLAAVRFVVVDGGAGAADRAGSDRVGSNAAGSATPGAPEVGYEVWLDGKRKVAGLESHAISPFLLFAPGEHDVRIRLGTEVLFREMVSLDHGSSMTYVIDRGPAGTRMLSVADVAGTTAGLMLTVLNLTSAPIDTIVGDSHAVVAPDELSVARPLPVAAASIMVGGRVVSIDRTVKASRLVLVTEGEAGDGPLISVQASSRYPSTMLVAGDVAGVDETLSTGRAPEYWLRRILSAFVVFLVVAATIATLKSFRVQALDSRVRARME